MDGCVSWCFENEGLETNTRARGLLTPGYQSQLAYAAILSRLTRPCSPGVLIRRCYIAQLSAHGLLGCFRY